MIHFETRWHRAQRVVFQCLALVGVFALCVALPAAALAFKAAVWALVLGWSVPDTAAVGACLGAFIGLVIGGLAVRSGARL